MKSEKELFAESWLERLGKLDEMIKLSRDDYRDIFERATDMTSCARDGISGGKGMPSRKVENAAIKLASLANEIDALTEQYISLRREIAEKLKLLPKKEYAVLHRLYVLKMSHEDAAEAMDISTVQVWRLKKRGLEKLADIIGGSN